MGSEIGDTAVKTNSYTGEAVVVCIDMWDSVARKKPFGSPEGHLVGGEVVAAHNQEVIRLLQAHVTTDDLAAWVVKDLGDGVMVVFPTQPGLPPVSQGARDSRLAGPAALRFAAQVVRSSADGKGPIQPCAVAISFGTVKLGRDPSALGYSPLVGVRGYPVDVASRLVAVAQKHQVLMCEAMRNLVGADFEVLSMESHTLVLNDDGRTVRLPGSSNPMSWVTVAAHQLVIRGGALTETLVGGNAPSPISNRTALLAQLAAMRIECRRETDEWRNVLNALKDVARESDRTEALYRLWSRILDRADNFEMCRQRVLQFEEIRGSELESLIVDAAATVALLRAMTPIQPSKRDVEAFNPEAESELKELIMSIAEQMSGAAERCSQVMSKGWPRRNPGAWPGTSL